MVGRVGVGESNHYAQPRSIFQASIVVDPIGSLLLPPMHVQVLSFSFLLILFYLFFILLLIFYSIKCIYWIDKATN